MSRRALGDLVNVTDSAVAAWESGRNIPDPETLRRLEEILGTNGLLQDVVDSIVSGEKPQEYMTKWVHVETRATTLMRFSYDVLPGLLQTEEYARAVLRDEQQVKTRIDRQKILEKEDPPVLVTLIGESVLHHNVGGPAVMRDQLIRLIDMAQNDNIVIHVIKMSSTACAQYSGPFSLASYDGQSEVAYLDDAISGAVVESPEEVSRLRRIFEMLRKHALSEEESLHLVRKAAESWQPTS